MATALINNCTGKPKESVVFACITTHQGTVSRSGKLVAGRTEDKGRRKRARKGRMKTRQPQWRRWRHKTTPVPGRGALGSGKDEAN